MQKHPMVRAFVTAALIVIARGASASTQNDTNNFRPDVFACEEAVSQLASCCPGFNPKAIRCVHLDYEDTGCDTATSYYETPAIDQIESACILHMSCDQLVANGVCTRAQAVKPERGSTSYDMGSESSSSGQDKSPPVCP